MAISFSTVYVYLTHVYLGRGDKSAALRDTTPTPIIEVQHMLQVKVQWLRGINFFERFSVLGDTSNVIIEKEESINIVSCTICFLF